jgi:beta-phosphoglucomutase-like phosphatase (HAD superfamily)
MKHIPKTEKQHPKFVTPQEAGNILQELLTELNCDEVAVVKNPAYINSPLELYPLAANHREPLQQLVGVVKDMDGTTTTTEPLCIHSLEWMVRKITNRMDTSVWTGLDHTIDYPHIIGNSTTKHIEYLIKTYESDIQPEAFRKAYLDAVIWTLTCGRDEGRRREVNANIPALGLAGLLEDNELHSVVASGIYTPQSAPQLVDKLLAKYGDTFQLTRFIDKVRAAVDIYYVRYHSILMDIAAGRGRERARELLSDPNKRLVEPMPAVAIFIALIKGWLGEDVALFYDQLAAHILAKSHLWKESELVQFKPRLALLGRYFQNHPVKVAIVTSSIAYEANIVLTEVFNVLREQIAEWPIADTKKEELIKKFHIYQEVYDGFITATDSSEIRLKPHRDLYSIALHQMGIPKSKYEQVVGFEDSESGTIAIRAAGIGVCVAVPFAETAGHDLSAATYILHGQLPETILAYNCFLNPEVLQ